MGQGCGQFWGPACASHDALISIVTGVRVVLKGGRAETYRGFPFSGSCVGGISGEILLSMGPARSEQLVEGQ